MEHNDFYNELDRYITQTHTKEELLLEIIHLKKELYFKDICLHNLRQYCFTHWLADDILSDNILENLNHIERNIEFK